jgi:hypothetical protein
MNHFFDLIGSQPYSKKTSEPTEKAEVPFSDCVFLGGMKTIQKPTRTNEPTDAKNCIVARL